MVGIVCALATASIDYHWNLPQLHFTNLTIVGLQITLISALSGAAFGIVRPYWYARCHRAKIDQNKVSFRIMPTIEPCSDHRGIDACIRLELSTLSNREPEGSQECLSAVWQREAGGTGRVYL